MTRRQSRLHTVAIVGGFAALTGLTFVLYLTPPATAYEISIYDAYPWYFWGLAVVAMCIGQYLVVSSALADGSPDGVWRYGFSLIVAVAALLFFLPYFRGYPVVGRADVLTHLGYIRVVQETATIAPGDIYPNLHLFVLSLSYATGIEPMNVINTFSGLVSVFALVATLALVRSVYGPRTALLTLPFVTLFVGGTSHLNASPYAQSTLLIPFVLYLFVKEQQSRSIAIRVALALVIGSTVIYHPLTTLFLLFFLVIFAATQYLFGGLSDADSSSSWPGTGGLTPVTQLGIAIFLVWYSGFLSVLNRIQTVLSTFLDAGSDGQSTLASYSSTASRTSPALVDVLRIVAVRYGKSMILLSLAGLYVLTMGYALVRYRRRAAFTVYELAFAGAFVLFTGLSVLFLVFDLVVGFGRPLLYARLFGGLLVGSFFWTIYQSTERKRLVRGALYVSIVLLVVVGTFGLYHSPYQISMNQQVTEGELSGSEWFIENRNPNLRTSEYIIDMHRFRDAHYGVTGYSSDLVFDASAPLPPANFNYTVHETLGESYDRDRYLLVTRPGRIFYEGMYPTYREFWRFEQADYDRLERDWTVDHVYDGGGFDAYRINGTRTG